MDNENALEDDERVIELSSIAAIYPEIVIDPTKPFDAALELQVAPSKPLKVRFHATADGAPPISQITAPEAQQGNIRQLEFLPPLTIHIHLPDGYPTEKPPIFKVSTNEPWLPQSTIQNLIEDGARLWEELGHDQVVFTYIDHLQQLAENAFGLLDEGSGILELPRDLDVALLDFDIKAKRRKFEQETFDCGICLEPKKGSVCHRMLACSHVFCTQCLQECYNNSITEGDVDNVKCLEPGCDKEDKSAKRRKKDPTLNPSELLQIPLEQDVVQRYVRMKRKKRLEADKSTIYCPRDWCQGAARSKKHPKSADSMVDNEQYGSDSEEEEQIPDQKLKNDKSDESGLPPTSERLCICEECSYAFCSVCKRGWHGELVACYPRKQAELTAEEKATEEYFKLHTSNCPTCSSPTQKTMGCNHMICHVCKTHFCYLCSSYLMPDNPYQHFNNPKGRCYMRLWELEGGDGEQVDLPFRDGVINNWAHEEESDDEPVLAPLNNHGDEDDPDSDDEEDVWVPGPAIQAARNRANGVPNQPNQPVRIEIINFAQGGAQNPRHIAIDGLPNRRQQGEMPPAQHPPPPAPVPPRRGRNNRPPNMHRQLPHRPPPAAVPQRPVNNPPANLPAAAPGQRRDAAMQPAPVRAMGLERFLELARFDREEEWDSDELDDVEFG